MVAKKDEELAVMDGKEMTVAEPVQMTGSEVALGGVNWQADAGGGLEGADKETYAIPFLRVIQKMSPQVDEAMPEYMEEARPGMLFNTVTGKLYDGKVGLTILPVSYSRDFLRWGARGTDNAGFKGSMSPEEVDKMVQRGEVKEVEGNLYAPLPDGTVDAKKCDVFNDTRTHFLIVLEPDGTMTQAVMALSSTQIKKSKRLMSMLRGAIVQGKTPPTWMNRISLTTVGESNEKGSWSGVRFEADGFIAEPAQYIAGKEFHDLIRKGEVGAAYENLDDSLVDPEGETIEGRAF